MAPMTPHKEKRYHERGKIYVLRKAKQIKKKPVIPMTKASEYPLFITSNASSRSFSSPSSVFTKNNPIVLDIKSNECNAKGKNMKDIVSAVPK